MSDRPGRQTVFLCLLIAAACSRYEWKPDYMVPEACPRHRPALPSARVYREVTLRGDSIRGHVSQATDSLPIWQAMVDIGSGARIMTDPSGKFGYGPLAPGLVALSALHIGYNRWQDTVRVVVDERPDLEIRLTMAVLDGPCSGFASVRVRRPWWKLW